MQNLVVITDPGKALDDEEMLVLLAHFAGKGLLTVKAVVANLLPSRLRARLASGTLEALGLTGVPCGAGTSVLNLPVQSEAELSGIEYLCPDDRIVEGKALLVEALTACEPGSVTLLLVSATSDAAALVHEVPDLVKSRVGQVVIMGGVVSVHDDPVVDADGYMLPDAAVNNHYDALASRFLYRKLQEIGVPMVIVTRYATYTAKLPRTLYERLASTGHPVGVRLGKAFEDFIADFWKAVNSPPGDLAHDGLPARWNREHFLRTFCEGKGQDRTAACPVIDLVKHTVLADPMALLAAVPDLRKKFFAPKVVTTGGVDHLVIGASPNATGVADAKGLVEYLDATLVEALTKAPRPAAIEAQVALPISS